MALLAAATICTGHIPSLQSLSCEEVSRQQRLFLSLSSISPCPFKPSTVTVQSRKRFNGNAKAPKSEPEVNTTLGAAVYKPKSYEVLVSDAAASLFYALQDGRTRLEIEFPPLPSSISSYKGSSDDFGDANIQLALAVVRKLQEKQETRACNVFPDKPERRRASKLFKAAIDFNLIEGISIGSLDDVPTGPINKFFKSISDTLDFDFVDENEGCFL